ncbi:S-formylglutathione hydrolase [Tanacetum coccineum]|uniref:S-formylglutathione hydrolase n=1 Tax=Tanacetum coccineum TaxID=301880 RepID=A0ABQ4XDK9_9ASTR
MCCVFNIQPHESWIVLLSFRFFCLSGLTCTEEHFIAKSGAQRVVSTEGIALIVPDTFPRGLNVEGESDSYDFALKSTLFDITNASATELPCTAFSEIGACSKEKELDTDGSSETATNVKETQSDTDGCHQVPFNKGNTPLSSDTIQPPSGRVNGLWKYKKMSWLRLELPKPVPLA